MKRHPWLMFAAGAAAGAAVVVAWLLAPWLLEDDPYGP